MNQLYTRKEPVCPWCVKSKNHLGDNNIKYTEYVLGIDLTRDEYVEQFFDGPDSPRPTVPLFIADGKIIGGYENILDWIKIQGDKL